jgi:hypothetical protein
VNCRSPRLLRLPLLPTTPKTLVVETLVTMWELSGTRTLDHAAYVQRDGLNPVSGLGELGHLNAMGLGWVIMTPAGDRPLILQKSGGRQRRWPRWRTG